MSQRLRHMLVSVLTHEAKASLISLSQTVSVVYIKLTRQIIDMLVCVHKTQTNEFHANH
jgi:hypothetical protein